MTRPLIVLAAFSVLLGFIGTPAWPWFQGFLQWHERDREVGKLFEPEVLLADGPLECRRVPRPGRWAGGSMAGALRRVRRSRTRWSGCRPDIFALLRRKYFVDEVYEATVIRFNAWWASACDWLDSWVWNGAVQSCLATQCLACPGSTASSTNTW